ncbi:MAG: excisionase family DNA-binding protein [Acidobacteria bacterium]|nr:excisionase family DNA-binding protein [Acidobacteriota bacterium]
MDTKTPLPHLHSVRGTAARTNIPKTTLYAAIARGELPAYRLGRNRGRRGPAGLRLDDKDVARWLASRREPAP